MSRPTTLSVDLDGALGDFVAERTGEQGAYADVGTYIRDLIRHDKEQLDSQEFSRLKADLREAFSASDDTYRAITAEEIFARNAR